MNARNIRSAGFGPSSSYFTALTPHPHSMALHESFITLLLHTTVYAPPLRIFCVVIVFFSSAHFFSSLVCLTRQTQTGGKQPTKGVLGFCAMLLKTCEYDAAPVFQKLLDAYQADLSKDEALFGVRFSWSKFRRAVKRGPVLGRR